MFFEQVGHDDHGLGIGLGDLAAFMSEQAVVQPKTSERLAGERLRLGDFVFMVRKDQVQAAAVDVEVPLPKASCSWPSIRCANPAFPVPKGFPKPARPVSRLFHKAKSPRISFARPLLDPSPRHTSPQDRDD